MTLKYDKLIRAALDGKKIQWRTKEVAGWTDFTTQQSAVVNLASPTSSASVEYRVAPPQQVTYLCVNGGAEDHLSSRWWGEYPTAQGGNARLKFKLTYDGETGKLKSVEIV